jgi:hypothetical protein
MNETGGIYGTRENGKKIVERLQNGSGESQWGYTEAKNREKKIVRHIHGVS